MPGKSHGQRAWRATIHGVTKASDTTELLNKNRLFKRKKRKKKGGRIGKKEKGENNSVSKGDIS